MVHTDETLQKRVLMNIKISDGKMDKLKAGLVGLLAALTVGCSSPDDAVRAAQSAGWKNVEVTDSKFLLNLTCAEGEIAYKIRGENPRGEESSATVCCGYTTFLKGCTIRY